MDLQHWDTTFSIVARCPLTGELGVAVATRRPAVGGRVPFVQPGIGAVATQANTQRLHGRDGLMLLGEGVDPATVLPKLATSDPDWAQRQVHLVDKLGRTAAHTGTETLPWSGHRTGNGYSCAGNMLAGSQVLEAMEAAFVGSIGSLADRLLAALAAGDEAGGDGRGKQSAAVQVAAEGPFLLVDIRVDDHAEPVVELLRIWQIYREAFL